METVFYKTFERHDNTGGLKGHATHYCAGCGHGLAHKFLAESIEQLGIQDRTIAISPVGCSVFLYYYLDVGNSQAAHGRAPAVALGHKLANPNSIVVSYQGDGDLASIGLAEILQVAQMGVPISVIFVNNAIYAMTGGQLAPTTLMNQRTTTSPDGRTDFMGQPLHMAELIAQLDGPVYVERVALYNNQQRFRARKAITKALRYQVEGRGFSFVEVLAECPTHLKMTPEESEKWVEECMVPIYPLGVKKEIEGNFVLPGQNPSFSPDLVLEKLETKTEPVQRFAETFPNHLDSRDIAMKFAGAGGDGAQTIAKLACGIALNEGWDATYIPSYGPESRGGTSYADVHFAAEEVLSPASPHPKILVAFNAPSLNKFGPAVEAGGVIIYDTTVISTLPELEENVRAVGVPLTQIAFDLGTRKVKNIVAMGALSAATGLFPDESFSAALKDMMHGNCVMLDLNREAFEAGKMAANEVMA